MTVEELTTFTEGGLDWTAEPATAEFVRAQIAAHLDTLEQLPGCTLIKRNLVRAVYRLPLAGHGTVIVKRYAVRGPFDWVKYTFRATRALEEWRVGRWLDAAGIATAVPLAMAERRRPVLQDAALVTREIPDTVHLNAYVEAHLVGTPERDAWRVRLYDDLARIVRRMHDAGYVHNDLHGGNILVNGPPAEARLHVIDLHSVSRHSGGAASAGRRWFDLLKLLHSMRTCSSIEERERVCRVYEEAGSGPSGTRATELLATGGVAAELEPRLLAMERKRVRSRTRRSLERSSRHDVTRAGPYRIHHLRTLPAQAFLPAIAAHGRTLAAGGAAVLKDARKSALTRQMLTVDGVERAVIVKQYRSDRLSERLKNVVRTPRAIAAWIGGNGLLVRGFEAAEPLALVLRGRGAGLSEAFVVMEDLGDQTRLDLVALARFPGDLDAATAAQKTALVAEVARTLRRLHAQGVYHADLKAVNLFLREDRDDAGRPRARLVFADWDRVEFDRIVTNRRRVKNLAQLSASVPVCISVSDRLRFFREYARDEPKVLRNWKRWFERIIDNCRQKIVVRMEPIE